MRAKDGRTRINEGVIILYNRAIKQPGLVIPIVSHNVDRANYYFQVFCVNIVRQRIKHINRQVRIIELTNGSRFTFPVDTELAKENGYAE